MKPVVGIDVAKGKSVVQCFLKRNRLVGGAETIPGVSTKLAAVIMAEIGQSVVPRG